MKLDWVNGGAEFVPKTMIGEAEDYLGFVTEANPKSTSLRDVWKRQLDFIAGVLSRTDSTITRSLVGEHVAISEAADLIVTLIHEPLRPMSTDAPSPVDAGA